MSQWYLFVRLCSDRSVWSPVAWPLGSRGLHGCRAGVNGSGVLIGAFCENCFAYSISKQSESRIRDSWWLDESRGSGFSVAGGWSFRVEYGLFNISIFVFAEICKMFPGP